MKFSKKWLQKYSKEELPDTRALVDAVTLNAFEIEEVTKYEDDDILDVKVLPNRAHDALGHRGLAHDVCALLGTTFIDQEEYYRGEGDASIQTPNIQIADEKACTRFMSVRIDGVQVTESPEWLKSALISIGQKSINSIVDVTNYVQFALNKPMHAYDAELIAGNTLSARYAHSGEKLITLDEKELILDETTLVIADTEKPLGLAGIKGGKFSGITLGTTSIILESANFNSKLIRKTAQKYGIRTDASKRFESEISDALVEEGLRMTIALVQKLNPNAKVGVIVDAGKYDTWQYIASVSIHEVNKKLGTNYQEKDIEEVFSRLSFSYRATTPRKVIEEQLEKAKDATYKNPSGMRRDAPHAFSCSSLMSYLFLGTWQPSISIDKYVYGEKVNLTDAKWGDLVFSNTGEGTIRYESVEFLPGTKVPEGIDHVGMYIGDGRVLHISKSNGKIIEEDIAAAKNFGTNALCAHMCDINEERLYVDVPAERIDLRTSEDLIEEVVRIKGLTSVPSILPKLSRIGMPHKRLFYENKIKNILYAHGFSDIMTYSFGNVGEVAIVKGLASDKERLRSTLSSGVLSAFTMNLLNAPLLSIDTIKLFEFGNVFTKSTEVRKLTILIDDGKKKTTFTEEVDYILSEIKETLEAGELSYETTSTKPYCIEIDFDTLISTLPEPIKYESLSSHTLTTPYQAVSPYPFIARDIATWVPGSTTWESVYALCSEVSNPLLARIYLFDQFSKAIDGVEKTSYAFRLIFQSFDRTLTDEEVGEYMEKYYALLKGKGYEIR